MKSTADVTYLNPKLFDFTTLDNYVAPENTLEAENPTWVDAKSRFYSLGEYHIFSESCKRRSPEEIEIKSSGIQFSDEEHDILLSAMSDYIELNKKEKAILKNLNITAFFRHKSIIHSRGFHGLAVVKDNKLCFPV